jgi:hypothetical protein
LRVDLGSYVVIHDVSLLLVVVAVVYGIVLRAKKASALSQ